MAGDHFDPDRFLRDILKDHFDESRVAKNLGSEVFWTVVKRLAAAGHRDREHAREAFIRVLLRVHAYLEKHGGGEVRNVRAWVHAIARHEVGAYLREGKRDEQSMLPEGDRETFTEVLRGTVSLTDAVPFSSRRERELVRSAIASLPPRSRLLILLDLEERLADDEIRRRMGIRTVGSFRKRKCLAFKALRKALEEQMSRP